MRRQNKKLYEEAVERNILNAERIQRETDLAKTKTKYSGKDLETAKTMLGVRKIDDYWDNRVRNLTATKIIQNYARLVCIYNMDMKMYIVFLLLLFASGCSSAPQYWNCNDKSTCFDHSCRDGSTC